MLFGDRRCASADQAIANPRADPSMGGNQPPSQLGKHTPTIFNFLQLPHASAGPLHGAPGAQRQLQTCPPGQSAFTVQAFCPEPPLAAAAVSRFALELGADLLLVDTDALLIGGSAPTGAGVHPANPSAPTTAPAKASLPMG